MEVYTLISLMRYLMDERNSDYANLNELIAIFENPRMDDLRKRFAIISGLRFCGLFEVGYHGTMFRKQKKVGMDWEINPIGTWTNPGVYQIFDLNLLNGVSRFDHSLN